MGKSYRTHPDSLKERERLYDWKRSELAARRAVSRSESPRVMARRMFDSDARGAYSTRD